MAKKVVKKKVSKKGCVRCGNTTRDQRFGLCDKCGHPNKK